MSQPKKPVGIIATIDNLLEVFNSLSKKETGEVAVDDLKKDLIELRNSVSELATGIMQLVFTLAQDNPQNLKTITDLVMQIVPNGIPNSRTAILNGLALIEMSIMNNNVSRQQLNTIATLTANSIVSSGLIDGLKILREFLKRFF